MARGKSINLFLMDGDANGMIKCTLASDQSFAQVEG